MIQAEAEEINQVLQSVESILSWECIDQEDGSVAVHVKTDEEDLRQVGCNLFFAFAKAERPVFEMTSKAASLEDVFIELTESEGKEG